MGLVGLPWARGWGIVISCIAWDMVFGMGAFPVVDVHSST